MIMAKFHWHFQWHFAISFEIFATGIYHQNSGNFQWQKYSDSEKYIYRFLPCLAKCHWQNIFANGKESDGSKSENFLPMEFPEKNFATISTFAMPCLPYNNMDENPYVKV